MAETLAMQLVGDLKQAVTLNMKHPKPAGLESHAPNHDRRLRESRRPRCLREPGDEFIQSEVVHAPRNRGRNAVGHQRRQFAPF